jgi:Zn-dependent protease with chaperone function
VIALGLIPFGCSMVLALTAGSLARRLSPAVAAPLLTLTALATALATGLVLCLAALAALARDPLVAALGHWPDDRADPWVALPPGVGIAAGTLAGLLLASALACLSRAVWDLARTLRGCRRLTPAGGRLRILRDERPAAFTVPVPLPGGAIVVSTGMLQLLPADERRALLAHEAAHLRRGHGGYVLLASLAAAANPLLRPVARQVRLAVELWADQLAASEVGDPRVVARALARASLATPGPRRSGGFRLAAAGSDIRARVQALTQLPPRFRPWAAASVLVLAMTASAVALTLAFTVHNQVEIAQYYSARAQAAATTPRSGSR